MPAPVDVPASDPRLPTRPLWAFVLLALPAIGIVATLFAYAVTWAVGATGRAAGGATVDVTFAGCAAARTAVLARVSDMGLPIVSAPGADMDPWVLRVVLPSDGHVAQQIPATLAQVGRLEVRAQEQVIATSDDVLDASVRMDLMMSPRTLVMIDADAAERVAAATRTDPAGALQFYVDGERVGSQANLNPVAKGELEIDPPLGGRDRWDATAAWSVLVDHPLPCAPTVTVAEVSSR